MEYWRSESDLFMRLDPGEKLVESLEYVAQDVGFKFAYIASGVGMVEGLELGWFCVNENDYDTQRISGTFDLSSISGNIASVDGVPKAHVHITINRGDFSTVSGHLIECRCHITMELALRIMHEPLTRFTTPGRPASFIARKRE